MHNSHARRGNFKASRFLLPTSYTSTTPSQPCRKRWNKRTLGAFEEAKSQTRSRRAGGPRVSGPRRTSTKELNNALGCNSGGLRLTILRAIQIRPLDNSASRHGSLFSRRRQCCHCSLSSASYSLLSADCYCGLAQRCKRSPSITRLVKPMRLNAVAPMPLKRFRIRNGRHFSRTRHLL